MSAQNRNGVLFIGAILVVAMVIGLGIWRSASAREECRPMANPYGAAPDPWDYQPAALEVREDVVKELDFKDLEQYGLDVTIAWKDKDIDAFLFSLSSVGEEQLDQVYDALTDSVRAAGARIHNDTIAGTEVKYVDSDDGSRPIWGIKGCTIVLVFGMDHRLADRIAASVFKD